MSKPKVSVVITTYNRADLVGRAIQSVLNQTYTDYEIIVVDDCSTDNTNEIVKSFHDLKIRNIYHEHNRNLPAARNSGTRIAKGDYIAFLDDDDEWEKNKLRYQMDLAITNGPECEVIYCGAKIIDHSGRKIGYNKPKIKGNIRLGIVKQYLGTIPSSCLFYADALRRIGGYDESLKSHIDHDIWMKMAKMNYCADYVDEHLVICYQLRNNRMTKNLRVRILATEQYINKWKEDIINWFGVREGKIYCRIYYRNVVAAQVINSLELGKLPQAISLMANYCQDKRSNIKGYIYIIKRTVKYFSKKIYIFVSNNYDVKKHCE